ncbi:hypothetical protein [Helicobacter pylori]|uniref:hypothetical protein n=1 Tax=Helicobacter pylori TaxID=210 RepID=UPI0003498AF9|nr:hypothetical protein [Helicobacter pylori]
MLPFIVGGAILAVGFGALAFFFDVETEKEKERQNTLKKDIKDYTHTLKRGFGLRFTTFRLRRSQTPTNPKDRRPLSQYYPTLFARN